MHLSTLIMAPGCCLRKGELKQPMLLVFLLSLDYELNVVQSAIIYFKFMSYDTITIVKPKA